MSLQNIALTAAGIAAGTVLAAVLTGEATPAEVRQRAGQLLDNSGGPFND